MKLRLRFLLGCFALCAFTACSGKNGDASDQGEALTTVDTVESQILSPWFYFSPQGIHPAASPQDIPQTAFTAWTEAVRVSDVAFIRGEPAFLINKLGILTTFGEKAALHRDPRYFPTLTAGGMYTVDGKTLIRFYANTTFAQGDSGQSALVEFNPDSLAFTPRQTNGLFPLDPSWHFTALDKIGSMWYAAFKKDSPSKVEFIYREVPSLGENEEVGREIDSQSYQNAVMPFPWSAAPAEVAVLLSELPQDMAFTLKIHAINLSSTQTCVKEGAGKTVNGTAVLTETLSAVLFADGTFYYRNAAEPDKKGVLRLPKLASGYVYTSFLIKGNKILSAWEEQRFFETGRSGILEIPLPDGVY